MTDIEIIGVIRLLPVAITVVLAIWRKKPAIVLWGTAFVLAIIANAFYKNQVMAGALSTVSAYTAAWIFIPWLINRGGKK